MASERCCMCEEKFVYQAKRKRYDCVSLASKFHREEGTGLLALQQMGVCFTPEKTKENYVCHACNLLLQKHFKWTQKIEEIKGLIKASVKSSYMGKKIFSQQTPDTPLKRMKRRKTESFTFQHKMAFKNYKKTAAAYLHSSKYRSLFRILFRYSKAARESFRLEVAAVIKREIGKLVNPSQRSVWRSTFQEGLDTCKDNFSWNKVLEEAEKLCPTFTACLIAAISSRQGLVRKRGKKMVSLLPNLGAILGQVVFARKPFSMKFLQEIIGVQLWLSGTAGETFLRLGHFGLTLGTDAVRSAVDNLRSSFDKELLEQKQKLSGQRNVRRQLFEDADNSLDETIPYEDDDAILTDNNNGLDETFPYEEDNITIEAEMEDTSRDDHEDTVLPLVESDFEEMNEPRENIKEQCLYSIVFDNVNKRIKPHYTRKQKGNQIKNMVQAYAALDRIPSLHLSDIPPTAEDVAKIPIDVYLPDENEIRTLRSDFIAVVTEQLAEHLPYFDTSKLQETVPHLYVKESMMKSKLIPLGFIDKDETKIADMVDIMESYHKYVPSIGADPLVIPIYGDQLSVLRAYDAQNARINAEGPFEQLQGLHPCVQEWHKRGILLQDTFRILFKQRSARSVGTLSYIRNSYRHTNVKSDVSQCFNAATDLLRFATSAYIIGFALNIMGCTSMDEIPKDLPHNDKDRMLYLSEIATQIVDLCFSQPNTSAVKSSNTSDKEIFKYCICKKDTGDDMIMCDNPKCKNGQWFHLSCMNISEEHVASEVWFCTEACGVKSQSTTVVQKDLVFEYSRAVVNRGLNELVRHKALRENNGPKVISHWKFDLFEFFEFHHPKYFLCGHQLITDTNGGLSERLAHQLKWNRTVNVKGGSLNNIEMDLQMEFYNKEFKEALKNAGGNVSEATMARYSEMVGVSRQLGTFLESICLTPPQHSRTRGEVWWNVDLQHLVNLLVKQNCCQKSNSPRSHLGFEDFNYTTSTSHPLSMKKRIEKHIVKRSKRLRLINASHSTCQEAWQQL